MKQISEMELQYILETLQTAEDELEAAIDDGWVITTDINEAIEESRMIINATLNQSVVNG